MIVSAIAAMDKNRVIGKDNNIPWRLPADLKFFKKTTLNHYIITGRKNFESMGILPKRTTIIITRDTNYKIAHKRAIVAHSIEQALDIAKERDQKEVFIVGGGEIYKQSMHLWDKLYLTEVDIEVENGDVFFPELQENSWKILKKEQHQADEKNPHNYVFTSYEKTPILQNT